MSATDHWFRFNVGDYLADTMDLTCLQHGIYIRLLMHAYKHGGEIPADERLLARIVKLPRVTLRAEGGAVLYKFNKGSGVYFHKRVLQELEHAKVTTSMGKHAASHRWPKGNGHADRNADRYADRNANQELELEPESDGSVATRPPRAPARATDRRQNAFMELGQALARQQRKGSHGH